MLSSLVFTLIGPDRPGLVERVASCVAEHGGNWEESEFLSLDGQFAGLVRVRVDERARARLKGALERLDGVSVRVAEAASATEAQGRVFDMELVGLDRRGIVAEIGRTLAALGVNMVGLESRTEPGAHSGEPMFRATAKLVAPSRVTEGDLRAALERLANDLMVELELTDEPVPLAVA
jgi:glycine cleavage system regulatory protein